MQTSKVVTPAQNGFIERVGDPFSKIKPISWLIHDHIERATLSMIFGPPACGKSFVATSMACSIASGVPWHGHAVAQTGVLYIAGEGLQGLMRRFAAWSKIANVDLTRVPLFRSTKAISIGAQGALEMVISEVKKLLEKGERFPGLIVIDTLARNFFGDENSTVDMSHFIAQLDDYFCKTYGSCVVIVHHSGHVAGRARGSSALNAAMDHVFSVTKQGGVITMVNSKAKESEPAKDINFEIREVDLGMYTPSIEDRVLAEQAGEDEPIAERIVSATLDITYDPFESIAVIDEDGFTIYVGEVVRNVARGYDSVDKIMDCLHLLKKDAIAALRSCAKQNLIKKDRQTKTYTITKYGQNHLDLEGDAMISKHVQMD